jgi:hypothetical protein
VKKKTFLAVLLTIYSAKSVAQLPTVCNSQFRDQVLPYIELLEKNGPSKLIRKIKKSNISDLIGYHMSYGLYIRNNWFYGKKANRDLMKMFVKAGIKHVDDMSQDLIEGIWAKNNSERCSALEKEHDLIKEDRSAVKIID